ncbi:hypothetical protein LINGRAHAP2_LOCUS35257 [Linum grandiflorum]
MRSIATCYSEHAVKVSDSYCSGPPTRPTIIARNLMKRPVPSSITSTYKLANGIFAAVNWSGGQGFSFSITDKIPPLKANPLDCPSSPSSSFRQFRKLKGSKEFQACGSKIELFWNLSLASYYDSGPEPGSGFYIVVLVDSKPALFLGDIDDIEEEEELLEFKSEIKRADFSPISRIEKFSCTQSGSDSGYTTRAQFSKVGEVHDVAIRFGSGEDGPAMSVWIDGRKAFEVERLKWNFRGNQTVFLDGISVDVMWDLHAWLDKGDDRDRDRGGVFMFRTRTGFDSRLWLDEKILRPHKDPDRDEFSLLICLCKDQRR